MSHAGTCTGVAVGSGVGAVMAEIMEAMCLGPGGYTLSFEYFSWVGWISVHSQLDVGFPCFG